MIANYHRLTNENWSPRAKETHILVLLCGEPMAEDNLEILAELERKVLWLATWMIHNANHLRPSEGGLKVGGHRLRRRRSRR